MLLESFEFELRVKEIEAHNDRRTWYFVWRIVISPHLQNDGVNDCECCSKYFLPWFVAFDQPLIEAYFSRFSGYCSSFRRRTVLIAQGRDLMKIPRRPTRLLARLSFVTGRFRRNEAGKLLFILLERRLWFWIFCKALTGLASSHDRTTPRHLCKTGAGRRRAVFFNIVLVD